MKTVITLLILSISSQLIGLDGRLGKSMIPLIIGEEIADSSVLGDSCRFYLEVSDHYNPREVDSLLISVFYKDSNLFSNFDFFNFTTDSNGKAQLTHFPGKYFVQISKLCSPDFKQDFEFIISKTGHSRMINSNITQLDPNMLIEVDKPVIYCYSEKKTKVEIKLQTKAELTFAYPRMDNSWKTTVYPNGEIEVNYKKYPYLFWEGKLKLSQVTASLETGFIVDKIDAISFFEEKLSYMGLNQREITDFITYWCPKMNSETYQIQFLTGETYNEHIGHLDYSIQPDTEIRIYALIAKYNGAKVVPQALPHTERKGFTVVEWGGSIIKLKSNQL